MCVSSPVVVHFLALCSTVLCPSIERRVSNTYNYFIPTWFEYLCECMGVGLMPGKFCASLLRCRQFLSWFCDGDGDGRDAIIHVLRLHISIHSSECHKREASGKGLQ